MSHDDELRSRLGRLAESHELTEVSFDSIEARGDRRARNRRVVLAASVLTLLLGTAGVLRLLDGDEAGDVDVASSAETQPDTEGDAEPDVAEATPTSSLPASTTTFAPGVPQAADSAAGSSVPVPGYGGPDWILPWGEGFLSLGQVFEPSNVAMLDLVPDIEDRFSPEIIAVLREAEVTDIPESIEVLSEAGLLDEATEAVTSDPVLLAAYNEVTQGGAYRFEASVSPDGENWTVLADFGAPGGSQNLNFVQSDGDRLVVAEQVWDSQANRTARLLVSSTTDLVNWTMTSLPFERPDVPDYVRADVSLNGVTIGPDGWYATANVSVWLDIWTLIPEDVRLELETNGYGWSPSLDGLVVESYDYDYEGVTSPTTTLAEPRPAPEQPTEIRTIPWTDLGITYEDYTMYADGGDGRSAQGWVGAWDGSITAASPAVATNCCQVIGTDTGLIAQSWGRYEGPEASADPLLYFSPDGQGWTAISMPPGAGWIGGIVAVDGGVLLTTVSDDNGAQQIWRGGPSGAGWQPVEIPGLPTTANLWFGETGSRGIATVVDLATYNDYAYEQIEYATTLEWGGFEIYNYNYADGSIDFTVTDLATGDIVLERLGLTPDGAVPDFVEFEGDSLSFLDDEGNVIVAVPMEEFLPATTAAQEAAREEAGWVEPDYQNSPDFWLVASLDGTDWFVEDLPDTNERAYFGPAAINGTTVVMRGEQGWVTYDIG